MSLFDLTHPDRICERTCFLNGNHLTIVKPHNFQTSYLCNNRSVYGHSNLNSARASFGWSRLPELGVAPRVYNIYARINELQFTTENVLFQRPGQVTLPNKKRKGICCRWNANRKEDAQLFHPNLLRWLGKAKTKHERGFRLGLVSIRLLVPNQNNTTDCTILALMNWKPESTILQEQLLVCCREDNLWEEILQSKHMHSLFLLHRSFD